MHDQKANLPKSATNAPPFLSTTTAACIFLHLQINNSSTETCQKTCLQTICCRTLHQNLTLLLEQQAILQQCLPTSLPQCMAKAHLLWRESALQKWLRQVSHLQPLREHAQAAATRSCLLAQGSALCRVVIRSAQRCAPPQKPASAGQRHINARAFQLNLCW